MPARSILLQSPICCRNGFLDIDDPLRGWGEPHLNIVSDSFTACSILSAVDRTAPCYPDFPHSTPSPVYTFLSSTQSVLSSVHLSAFSATYDFDPILHSLAYKPVAKKVRPVLAPLKEEYQMLCWLPDDPLAGLIQYHYQLTPQASSLENDSHRNVLMCLTSTLPNGCGRKR